MRAHPHLDRASHSRWRRWLGLSEVWVGGALSSRMLILLRWLAAAGQSVTLVVVWLLGGHIPWAPCAAAVTLTLLSNAALEWWLRQTHGQLQEGFFHVLLWDTLLLTFLLHWTGGIGNPFALFYLVHLMLAAVTLRTSAATGLGLFMAAECLWLLLEAAPLRMKDGAAVPEALVLWGTYTALLLGGIFVLLLLLAMRRRSHVLQKEQARLRAELESRERFLSVAALATGFAHELSTPLATIALAAEENLTHPDPQSHETISREAARSLKILQRLRTLGWEATGLSAERCQVSAVVAATLQEIPESQRARVRVHCKAAGAQVACAGLQEALLVLLRNALHFSREDQPVELAIETDGHVLRFTVEDQGAGFSPEMLRHWGEPFRTTRAPGSGMGLGLFFVRRLAASMQGELKVANRPSGGAQVTLILPVLKTPAEGESS